MFFINLIRGGVDLLPRDLQFIFGMTSLALFVCFPDLILAVLLILMMFGLMTAFVIQSMSWMSTFMLQK